MASAAQCYTFTKPLFPPGQKIVTQLPKEIALIRIVATMFFTACVVAKIGWSWPVVALGVGFAAYTAYKHLIVEDPLIDALCDTFGHDIDDLKKVFKTKNEFPLDPNKSFDENITAIKWDELEHLNCKAVMSDGRKVMIVKGYSNSHLQYNEEKEVLVFVEKLGPHDLPWCDKFRHFENKRLLSILVALGFFGLENPFSADTQRSGKSYHHRERWSFHAFIPTDMANEFIAQRLKRKD